MLLNTDYVRPAELTGYAREGLSDLPQNQHALAGWLPNRDIDHLVYEFQRGGEGLAEAATYRAFDTESGIASRPGTVTVSGKLPPISRKIQLGEYDTLLQRRLEERIRGAIMRDSLRMMRAVAARIELARGEALANGKLELEENGLEATVDYGRKAEHTVTAGVLWSDPAAPMLSNLRTWRDTYVDSNDGVPPEVMMTSKEVIPHMLRNNEVRAMLGNVNGSPPIVTEAALNEVLAAHKLPRLVEYNAQVKVGGTNRRVVPANRVLLLPAPVAFDDWENADLGATLWGPTAESMLPAYELDDEEGPGLVVGAYYTEDPVSMWTKASAISLPVLANPNLSFSAEVLAP